MYLVFILQIPQVIASNSQREIYFPYESSVIDAGKVLIKGEKIVGVKTRVLEGRVYFNLTMLNEEKESVYSLVRQFEDGSFTSVDLRFGVKNSINTPLLYCFVDKEVPKIDFIYCLYRISDKTTTIQKWHYCASDKELCPFTPDMLAAID